MNAAMTVLLIPLIIGFTTAFWSLVGLGRWGHEARAKRAHNPKVRNRFSPRQVAVLVAAHNEHAVIAETIHSAARLVPVKNIHVVSDGSTDRTVAIAHRARARVLELTPNRGKAGALAAGIEHFDLCRKYKVVLLLDADTHLSADYLRTGLPLFNDARVVAVAGDAHTIDDRRSDTRLGRFLLAYRQRLYAVSQLCLKYGQASKWANAVTIVPGFASMYRTKALKKLDVVGEGLAIEDYNMTFDVHTKRLGRIAFRPQSAVAYTQDPDNFHDYRRQISRWILGFWQTVRRHPVQPGIFWASLVAYIVELVLSCFAYVVVVPLSLLWLLATQIGLSVTAVNWPLGTLTPQLLILAIVLPDYLLTILAAVYLRRPRYLLLGFGFPAVRAVDATVCLVMLPRAWLARSNGAWVSPARRANQAKTS